MLQACIKSSNLLCAVGAAFGVAGDTAFQLVTSSYAAQQIRSIVKGIAELSAVGKDVLYKTLQQISTTLAGITSAQSAADELQDVLQDTFNLKDKTAQE